MRKAKRELRNTAADISLTFLVNKAEIDSSDPNNEVQLNNLRDNLMDIINCEDCKLNEIRVTGVSSPEGNYQSNLALAQRRAAFARGQLNRLLPARALARTFLPAPDARVAKWSELIPVLEKDSCFTEAEAVQAIMEELDKQKEALGDRYPNKLYNRLRSLMESTLNNQADWVQFETYFNSAYHNFMDRLRQQYTDITAGDLRICCLLRMNLSTKEIASLMNVSVRAIELRRYRLRKRLSLDGDTNLVDFLMNF